MSGRRLDISTRPELMFGSVEWTATAEYCSRAAVGCRYLFAIDVSHGAVQSGMVETVVEGIRQLLYGSASAAYPFAGAGMQRNTRIGIMTFDSTLHYYNLHAALETPQMVIQADANEVFSPLSSGLFVDPVQSRRVIEGLLDSLPSLFSGEAVSVCGAAAQSCLESLKETGGKVLLFQAVLPTAGPGALVVREDAKILGLFFLIKEPTRNARCMSHTTISGVNWVKTLP